MKRLSVLISQAVEEAIGALEVPQAVRDGIEWEIMPIGLWGPAGTAVAWLVGIGVKVPATGDWEFPFGQLGDPHDRDEIRTLVRVIYAKAQADADESQKKRSLR